MNITLRGVPFNSVDLGNPSAMPVVFLHGFPFSLEMWRPQLDVVSRQYRALAYDLRGHGGSFVGDGQFTLEDHVNDLFAYLDVMKAGRPVIVGLSMGGYIALRALERDQSRFRAAVLADTRSEADTNESKIKRAAGAASVKANGSAAFADEFIKAVFAPSSITSRTATVNMFRTIIARTPPLSIAGTLIAVAGRTDTTPFLPHITIPTLIMVGESDVTTPPSSSRSIHEKVRGSELHMVPGAAHMSNLENPEFFNEKLLAFLNRVAAI